MKAKNKNKDENLFNQRSLNLENRKTKTKEKRNKIPRKLENKKINLEFFVVAEKTCRVRGAPPLR